MQSSQDGRIELAAMIVDTDGRPDSSLFSWPAQGGTVQFQQVQVPQNRIMTKLAAGEWCLTVIVDGRQGQTRHKVVSKDRKTMRQTVKTLDPQGKVVEQIEVYDRQ